MASTDQDFTVYEGDDQTVTITVVNAAGVAVDISGATVAWTVSSSPGGTALISKATCGSGITLRIVAGMPRAQCQ